MTAKRRVPRLVLAAAVIAVGIAFAAVGMAVDLGPAVGFSIAATFLVCRYVVFADDSIDAPASEPPLGQVTRRRLRMTACLLAVVAVALVAAVLVDNSSALTAAIVLALLAAPIVEMLSRAPRRRDHAGRS